MALLAVLVVAAGVDAPESLLEDDMFGAGTAESEVVELDAELLTELSLTELSAAALLDVASFGMMVFALSLAIASLDAVLLAVSLDTSVASAGVGLVSAAEFMVVVVVLTALLLLPCVSA